jgi:2-polyprenyl-3-methyl-5-hydroxy-6-metoxy-1,4-benzoquinol methylase
MEANYIGHDLIITTYIDKLIPNNIDGLRILEYGCYKGFWCWFLRSNKKGTPQFIFGVDTDSRLLPLHAHLKLYDLFCITDYRSHDLPDMVYMNAEYDLVLFTEVIEHMNKKQGRMILEALLDISKHIIISTPRGYMRNTVEDNPYLTHLSGWDIKDFSKYGLNHIIVKRKRIIRLYLKFVKLIRRNKTAHEEFLIVWK